MLLLQIAVAALAILRGSVRDAANRPVSGALVSLRMVNGGTTLTATTDSGGRYRFESLRPGSYRVRVQNTSAGPFEIRDTKNLDLQIAAPTAEFFDDPKFTAAGVTDSSSHGGHGSDTVRRSSEELAEATVSLGNVEEKSGALESVREYQRAAEANPSEANLFNWGAELLKHRAAFQAQGIFSKGNELFPGSVRMLLGLGAAAYSLRSFDRAAEAFFAATDLKPGDATPYLFLGKVQTVYIGQQDGLVERMARFAKLQPTNALANYYYAASLRRQGKAEGQVEALLRKAIGIDPQLAEAYLELGILAADRQEFPEAVGWYRKAIEVDSQLEQAHYRLGLAYRRVGEDLKAKEELEIYTRLSQSAANEAERKRGEIQEFVFALR